MKKILILFAVFGVLAACSDGDKKPQPEPLDQMLFSGTVSVNDDAFTQQDVRFELAPADEGRTVTLLMHETKFAERMPVLDMSVPGIGWTGADGAFTLEAAEIIPEVDGIPQPNYTVTDLEGTVADDALEVSFSVGQNTLVYTGTLVEN